MIEACKSNILKIRGNYNILYAVTATHEMFNRVKVSLKENKTNLQLNRT